MEVRLCRDSALYDCVREPDHNVWTLLAENELDDLYGRRCRVFERPGGIQVYFDYAREKNIGWTPRGVFTRRGTQLLWVIEGVLAGPDKFQGRRHFGKRALTEVNKHLGWLTAGRFDAREKARVFADLTDDRFWSNEVWIDGTDGKVPGTAYPSEVPGGVSRLGQFEGHFGEDTLVDIARYLMATPRCNGVVIVVDGGPDELPTRIAVRSGSSETTRIPFAAICSKPSKVFRILSDMVARTAKPPNCRKRKALIHLASRVRLRYNWRERAFKARNDERALRSLRASATGSIVEEAAKSFWADDGENVRKVVAKLGDDFLFGTPGTDHLPWSDGER